jgi:hypothetical protein
MPKAPFLAVGLLEALGAATGMAAGGNAHFILLLFVPVFCFIGLYLWTFLIAKCIALYELKYFRLSIKHSVCACGYLCKC